MEGRPEDLGLAVGGEAQGAALLKDLRELAVGVGGLGEFREQRLDEGEEVVGVAAGVLDHLLRQRPLAPVGGLVLLIDQDVAVKAG